MAVRGGHGAPEAAGGHAANPEPSGATRATRAPTGGVRRQTDTARPNLGSSLATFDLGWSGGLTTLV